MIDTVTLSLAEGLYRLVDEAKHQAGLAKLRSIGVRPGDKYVQNPTSRELAAGIYKPRLTFIARPRLGRMAIDLKIEFSAPKLLFGNNFEELVEADFDALIESLRKKLQEQGVEVFSPILRNTEPVAIHPSKNFVFQDFTTSSLIIDELSKADVTARLDLTRAKYRNEGHGLVWHADSFEVVFYDKVKDLEQTKLGRKRAFDRENLLQLPLLDVFQEHRPFEVMRFEVRLTKKKLNSLLKKLGHQENMKFYELFNPSLSLEILNELWQPAIKGLHLLLPTVADPLTLYQNLRLQNPELKPDKLMKLTLALLVVNKDGFRKLRQNYEGKTGNWPRLKKELQELNITQSTNHAHQKITEMLKSYKPVKFTDYPDVFENDLITNDNKRYSEKNERIPIPTYDYD